jgi:small GTP-binding protein
MKLHFVKSWKKKAALKDISSKFTYEPFYRTLKTFHEEIPDNLEVSESNYFGNTIAQILKEKPEVEHEKARKVAHIPSQRIEKKRRIKEQQIKFKIDIIGKKGVGISTLVDNYTYNMFPDSYINTVGVDFYLKEFSFNGTGCIIQLWTHSNDLRFKSLRSTSLVGTNGMIIVYDITDRNSLQAIDEWIPLIRARDSKYPIMLLGNKVDLNDIRQISEDEIATIIKKYHIPLSYEISALTGTNVDFAFSDLLLRLLEQDIGDFSIENAQIISEEKGEITKSFTEEFSKKKRRKPSYHESLKIILFGEPTANKTRLTQKFLNNLSMSESKNIIGIDFKVRLATVDNKRIKLQIWDFKDKKKFKVLFPKNVRGVKGGLFIYDINNSPTLRCIDDWLHIINKEVKEEDYFPIMLVGLISGVEKERQISTEEGINAAKSRRLDGFIECNVETGENVGKVFEALAKLMLEGF